MKRFGFRLLILLFMIGLTACMTSQKEALDKLGTETTSTDPVSNQKIIFPIQQLINGERVSMDGLAQGTLVASDSCIRLKGENSDISLMVVWPPDYKYSIEEGIINILNGKDEIVAKVGDKVKISGGGVEIFSFLPKYIQDQMPSTCTPPYWIMGDEIYLINGDSK